VLWERNPHTYKGLLRVLSVGSSYRSRFPVIEGSKKLEYTKLGKNALVPKGGGLHGQGALAKAL
jgi:hypothetical protein